MKLDEETFMDDSTPIDEIISLLDTYSPEELRELRVLYPNEQLALTPTRILGGGEIPLPLAVDACLRGMRTTRDICKECLRPVAAKLSRANQLQHCGKIISVIGSASLLVLLATTFQVAKYAASVLAFAGNLLPQIAEVVSSTLHPEEKNLFELYNKLTYFQSQAAPIYDELVLCKRGGYSVSGSARDLIKRGNAISYDIQGLLRRQGMTVERAARTARQ